MPPPYCGNKMSTKRTRASHPNQCKGQIRAFGRRIVPGGEELLRLDPGRQKQTCGAKPPFSQTKAASDCRQQWRWYGLLPVVETRDDLLYRSYSDRARLPSVRVSHGFASNVYENTSSHSRNRPFLFVSVLSRATTDTNKAALSPQDVPGGIGFSFGYFVPGKSSITFNIAHVFVNPPYRHGRTHSGVASMVVECLVSAVHARTRVLHPDAKTLVISLDPNAICHELGNRAHLTDKQSNQLEAMYSNAGFEPVPLLERGRRTMKRVIRL